MNQVSKQTSKQALYLGVKGTVFLPHNIAKPPIASAPKSAQMPPSTFLAAADGEDEAAAGADELESVDSEPVDPVALAGLVSLPVVPLALVNSPE